MIRSYYLCCNFSWGLWFSSPKFWKWWQLLSYFYKAFPCFLTAEKLKAWVHRCASPPQISVWEINEQEKQEYLIWSSNSQTLDLLWDHISVDYQSLNPANCRVEVFRPSFGEHAWLHQRKELRRASQKYVDYFWKFWVQSKHQNALPLLEFGLDSGQSQINEQQWIGRDSVMTCKGGYGIS